MTGHSKKSEWSRGRTGRFLLHLSPVRIAFIYALMGVLWIVLSDGAVDLLFGDGQFAMALQTYKGIGYVIVTSLLLFWLIRQAEREYQSKETRFRDLFEKSLAGVWYARFREPVPEDLPPEEQFEWMMREIEFTECNDTYAQMYGRQSGEELIGQTMSVMGDELDRESIRKAVVEVLRSGRDGGRAELSMTNIAGNHVRYLEWFQFGREDGKIVSVWGTTFDLSDRMRFEQVLESMVVATASQTGPAFFAAVVDQLAQLLNMRTARIAELSNNGRSVRTLAEWSYGGLVEPAEYDLKDTPCAKVASGELGVFSQNLFDSFPKYKEFCHEDIESYLGAPLLDAEARPIGLLTVMDSRPIPDETAQTVMSILKIFAARVSAEILRERAESDLRHAFGEVKALQTQLQADNLYLREEIAGSFHDEHIVGDSEPIRKVMQRVEQVSGVDTTVLILGETGTGKELIARAIHKRSGRSGRPLIRVNCAALPATLIESELFGHEKGAFTGASQQRKGRFELADRGTLLLDEIGEMPLELQPKLLRAMQEGEFERLGGHQTIKVDVRVIAATNRNLEQEVADGKFREDLYYRLNVLPIFIPPLRERMEDLPLLIKAFANKMALVQGKQFHEVSGHRIEKLKRYHWPGNVRELHNVIERAMILSRPPTLELEIPEAGEAPSGTEILTLENVQKNHIASVLKLTGGRISGPHGAASLLGLKPTTLRSRMDKLGISATAIDDNS